MLRIALALLVASLVSGCANDRYVVDEGGPGSQQRLSSDLWDCKQDVQHRYFASQNQSGVVAAGVLFGGVGGAVAGALNANSGTMKTSDIDPAIEACMKQRGYTGTSEN
jgi:hypothetical protein